MTATAIPRLDSDSSPPSRALNVTLWIVQVLLASLYGLAGAMKATQPIAVLAEKLVWPGALPPPLVRFIGVSELLGSAGLILPALTRNRPGLTPLAALGLAVVMCLAIPFHLSRGELFAIPMVGTLGLLAAFVAWGRWRKAPIRPRG